MFTHGDMSLALYSEGSKIIQFELVICNSWKELDTEWSQCCMNHLEVACDL